ncbi:MULTISPECIES: nuclear transport factor 2 family protein [Citricoccus]|uniref:nuclear transport factor 2 family protein n=1 Tax=Citricoccus TaxID=169133 RepID=UPI000255DFF5|nr:nuclear transport factor 2 family protein [Citricoccus sp. CH26A]
MTENRATSPTPEVLADIQAIRWLTGEYARAVDSARLDDLMSLFADDAEWDTTAFGMGVERGLPAIREFFAQLVRTTRERCHLAMNHRIDVDGDTASATVYLHAIVVMEGGRRDESIGYYADDYVRTAAGWKFSRRAANALMAPPPAPVSSDHP